MDYGGETLAAVVKLGLVVEAHGQPPHHCDRAQVGTERRLGLSATEIRRWRPRLSKPYAGPCRGGLGCKALAPELRQKAPSDLQIVGIAVELAEAAGTEEGGGACGGDGDHAKTVAVEPERVAFNRNQNSP